MVKIRYSIYLKNKNKNYNHNTGNCTCQIDLGYPRCIQSITLHAQHSIS